MFDMDFDDPALNQLLGVDMSLVTDTSAARAELQAKDLAFAEVGFACFPWFTGLPNSEGSLPLQLIRSSLSPALYRLLSELFADREGRAEPTVEGGYAARLVECWTRGLAVMVEHSLVVRRLFFFFFHSLWSPAHPPFGS